jgi:hypothetical protein
VTDEILKELVEIDAECKVVESVGDRFIMKLTGALRLAVIELNMCWEYPDRAEEAEKALNNIATILGIKHD